MGKNVKEVRAVYPHVCHQNAITCHGEDHEVDLVDAPNCWDKPGTATIEILEANVVIIRHGVDPSVLPPLPDIALPRQMTAYHVS